MKICDRCKKMVLEDCFSFSEIDLCDECRDAFWIMVKKWTEEGKKNDKRL